MSQELWGPDPRMIPYAGRGLSPPRHAAEPSLSANDLSDDLVVRPFMLTNGRTRPLHDGLRIETLMRAAPAALSAPLRFESRRVVELCQQPMSIADLSVGLRAPMGVVRVIAADLITDGYLRVEDQPDELPIALIERIRDRVRAL
jgi:hypothetical protein